MVWVVWVVYSWTRGTSVELLRENERVMGIIGLLFVLVGVFGFAALFGDGLWEDKQEMKELKEITDFRAKHGVNAELPEHLKPAYKRIVKEMQAHAKRYSKNRKWWEW